MFIWGMYLWKIVWNIFSETFVTKNRISAWIISQLCVSFPLEKLWGKRRCYNFWLFFHLCGIYKERAKFFMQLFHCHSPSNYFLIKNPSIYSISMNQKEKETVSLSKSFSFGLPLDQALVLTIFLRLRTKRDKKNFSLCASGITVLVHSWLSPSSQRRLNLPKFIEDKGLGKQGSNLLWVTAQLCWSLATPCHSGNTQTKKLHILLYVMKLNYLNKCWFILII